MSKQENYYLKTGEEGEGQLDNLDYFFGKSSREFLQAIGLAEGMHVLDVGCGVGNLSCWLAEYVGNSGKVLGVDFDAKQIEVAEHRAKSKGIKNISFAKADAHDLSAYQDQFDLSYCRWLLLHVNEPEVVVNNMSKTLRTNGILALEVGDLNTTKCYPAFPIYEYLRGKVTELYQLCGHDVRIAENIFAVAKSLEGFSFDAKLAQTVLYDKQEAKRFIVNFTLVLDSMADAFIEHNLMSNQDIEQLRDDLQTHPVDENTIVFLARMTQVFCKRLA